MGKKTETACRNVEKNVHFTPEMGDDIVEKVNALITKHNESYNYNNAEFKVYKSKGGYLQQITFYGDILDDKKDIEKIAREIEKILKSKNVEFDVWMAYNGAGLSFHVKYF